MLLERLCLTFLPCLTATAFAASGNLAPGEVQGEKADSSYFHERGYTNLPVPKRHLPSAGQCRVWHPGKSEAEQPPQGKCMRVSRQVPTGAWLIARSSADPLHVQIHVYDEQSAGVVIAIGVFSVDTQDFIRYVSP